MADTPTEVMPTGSTAPKPSQARSSSSVLSSSFAESADGSRFLPGTLLAERYRIVALLGRGGMGEVYRADDLTLGQPVALKFLAEAVTRNEDAVRRFRNEVRIARQVSHPNVCRVYDVGEIEGRLFLSMEYVDGEDLASLLRRIGRLPEDKGLEIARKLCAGLAAAHEKGVLHRDLKPGNIMLDGRGQVLLTDFGLAGLAEQITGADVRSGTPAYMAPEQLSGSEVTAKSDIYSLGLVLYELFTGKRAFEASTLDELIRLRTHTTPTGPATLVRDFDPAVERVILRCLDPDPAQRPASALAVSAALPGGDPLAAALAAGETPSPQMVAAAGEGVGLSPRIAVGLFAVLLVVAGFCAASEYSRSAVEILRPPYSPEVLSNKTHELLHGLGYNNDPADEAHGYAWNNGFISWVSGHEKSTADLYRAIAQPPSALRFWYRQSPYPMTAITFHDEQLTPGVVSEDDPPAELSGMIGVSLDAQGRLRDLEAIPDQVQAPLKQPASAPNWNALLTAAGLDPSHLQPAEPERTWLASFDTRAAWTGTWPGTTHPLRVEAAAWRGRPVAFTLIGPWSKPDRQPPPDSSGVVIRIVILGCLAVVFFGGGGLLARRNLLQGRGDRRSAFQLALWIFVLHLVLWTVRSHFTASIGVIGMFMLVICTSTAYAVVVWAVYLALEPYVRRRWPHAIISTTRVLSNQVRDPIVGRDILVGFAMGISWRLIGELGQLLGANRQPALLPPEVLEGARATLGGVLVDVPRAVINGLLFFFILFLMRVLLRNQWLAAAAFIAIFVLLNVAGSDTPLLSTIETIASCAAAAIVMQRFGLLALVTGFFVVNTMVTPTLNASAWYFSNVALVDAGLLALMIWACVVSMGGRRLWKQDLFG